MDFLEATGPLLYGEVDITLLVLLKLLLCGTGKTVSRRLLRGPALVRSTALFPLPLVCRDSETLASFDSSQSLRSGHSPFVSPLNYLPVRTFDLSSSTQRGAPLSLDALSIPSSYLKQRLLIYLFKSNLLLLNPVRLSCTVRE